MADRFVLGVAPIDYGPVLLRIPFGSRLAADTLLFCAELGGDTAAHAALADMAALCRHLETSGRWLPERAGALLDDVWDCGPSEPGTLAVAA